MRLPLFVDLEARKIVGGLNDPSPAALSELMQGDTVDVVLQGVAKNDDTTLDYYRATAIPFAGIKCAITRGADVAPTGGTIRLRLTGGATNDVTPAFAPDITKPALQALLNALPGVVAKGGLVVQTSNTATNIFRLRWNNAEETAAFEFTENRLEPRSDTRSVVVALPNGQLQALKVRQLPLAFTDQFYLPQAPVLKVASVRTGTSTRNCIQAISTPRASVGQVHFVFQSHSTRILSVTGLTPVAVAAALNDLYSDGQTRFAITQPSSTVLYVEFVGPLAMADQPLLGVQMHDQAPVETPTARLPLDGSSLELAFDGAKTLPLTFELEITDTDGKVGTPIQIPVTIRNDVIDGPMALNTDPDWIIPLDPTYPPYDPAGATISAPGAYVTPVGSGIGTGTSGQSFVITHHLGTSNVLVGVRETGGTHHRIPDNQYVCTILDDNRVQVDFQTPPTDGQYYVVIAAVIPAAMALPHHTHPIGDIVGLQALLDELLNGINPDAPISEGSLPTHIPWYNKDAQGNPTTPKFDPVPDALIPANIARLPLAGADLPPGTPYYVPGPPPSVVVTLPGPPPVTIPILVYDPDTVPPTWTLPVGILPDPVGWPGLTAAILAAIQQGASLPNLTVFDVADYTESFPPAFELANHCAGDTGVATVPSSILPAVFGTTLAGNVSDELPPAGTPGYAGKRFTVVNSATAPVALFRERRQFRHGEVVASNGYHWFKADVQGSAAYPAEYNRELFSFYVSPDMLVKGSRFAVDFTLQAQLATPDLVRGQYTLTVEIGSPAGVTGSVATPNLATVNWAAPVVQETIILGSANAYHHFAYAVSCDKATAALTATKSLYSTEGLTAPAPAGPGFVVRATLTQFDLEDAVPNPSGRINLKMLKTRANVVKLTS